MCWRMTWGWVGACHTFHARGSGCETSPCGRRRTPHARPAAAGLPPAAVLCVNCGYNLKTGKMLSVVVETDEDEPEPPAKGGKAAG